MAELPPDLLRNVASRLNARKAIALSQTSKAMYEATGAVAVATAVGAARNPVAAAHAGLRKAATLPDTDASDRAEILRRVARRIREARSGDAAGLVHEFLRTIGPLSPADRADALGALRASLPRPIERHQEGAVAVLDSAAALEQISQLPVNERAAALAAHAQQAATTDYHQALLAILEGTAEKLGELPVEHRSEVLAAIGTQLAQLPEHAAAPRLAHQLLALTQGLPADTLGQLPVHLAKRLEAPAEPSEAFDVAWNEAMRLADAGTPEQREPMGALLAKKISGLSPAARHEAFDRTLTLLQTLPSARARMKGLEQLAKGIESLPEAAPESTSQSLSGRADALLRLLDLAVGTGDGYQEGVLKAAAAVVKHVTHRHQAVFDRTLAAVNSLPPSPRTQGLMELVASALSQAPDRAHAQFGQILRSTKGLVEEERAAIVLAAARALGDMPLPGSLPVAVLEQIPGLHISDQQTAFQNICRKTRWDAMSSDDLVRTTKAVLSLLSQLPAHSSNRLAVQAAFLPMAQMEAGVRTEFFAGLLQQAERDPSGQLLEVIARKMGEANDPALLLQGFDPLLRLADQPEEVNADALSRLAGLLHALPDSQLQAAWPQVRSLADRMDSSEDIPLDYAIAGLAETVPRLKPAMQREAVEWMQQSIPRLFETRRDWGACCKALTTLVSLIADLPQGLRLGAFGVVASNVGKVLDDDRRADRLRDDDGNTLHPEQRAAALLAQLARSAKSLPGLEPRVAVGQILASLQDITHHASRAEVLQSLAREALPSALETPVTFGMRLKKPAERHVSRELLLQSFTQQVDKLSPDVRASALAQMVQDARTHAPQGARSSGDKSGKLLELLESLR